MSQTTTTNNTNTDTTTMTMDTVDILRLIQAFLIEQGYTETVRRLQEESSVKLSGLTVSKSTLIQWCLEGQWGNVLNVLSTMEATAATTTTSNHSSSLTTQIHELAIIELAHAGAIGVAYSVLRLVKEDLLGGSFEGRFCRIVRSTK